MQSTLQALGFGDLTKSCQFYLKKMVKKKKKEKGLSKILHSQITSWACYFLKCFTFPWEFQQHRARLLSECFE